jgi:ABC-type sugar transport system ATPase subunit
MSMSASIPGPAALELRDVAKSFGAVIALSSATLRVEMNSIHAFVGENGAGKSTLVKIVAGLVSPTTVGIAAAAKYLSASAFKGKVALTGLGTPNQMRDYVNEGTVLLGDPYTFTKDNIAKFNF